MFSPGVYSQAVLKPLHQQTLVGHGAIFDGEGVTPSLVDSTTAADDIHWVGFEVTGYTDYAFDWGATGGADGWHYDQLYIHDNATGIRIRAGLSSFGGHVEITNSLFKDNLYHAIVGGGGAVAGSLIAGNEFDNNDQARLPGAARGQLLLTGGGARNWTVRDNWVHDGDATGIHFDGRHDNVTIENNLVERHGRAGISFELSDTTDPRLSVIRGNTVIDSGLSGNTAGGDGAGILVLGARNVRVEDNTVSGVCGIVARQSKRVDSQTGVDFHIEDVLVRNNTVHMEPGSYSGLYDTTTDQLSLTTAANNHFEGNTYTGTVVMRWGAEALTLAEWQQIFPNDG